MGQGYIRNDIANNIAPKNVANPADIDGEFDAIVAAFATSGHTHDGTSAEGGPIEVIGPVQDYVASASDFTPKLDSSYGLGTTGTRWSTAFIDDLVLTNALPVNQGGTGSTSASAARTALGLAIGTNVQAFSTPLNNTTAAFTTEQQIKLALIEDNADVTDTANVTAAGALMDSEVAANIKTLVLPANVTISGLGRDLLDDVSTSDARTTLGLGTMATQNFNNVAITGGNITGGTITGITDLAIAHGGTGASTAAGALSNFGLTATAAELNKLDGVNATTNNLNGLVGLTSNVQTQLDTKAPLESPVFTGSARAVTLPASNDETRIATTAYTRTAVPDVVRQSQINAVGSYMLLRQVTLNTPRSAGTNIAGSDLRYTSAGGLGTPPAGTPSGTWRCMGAIGTASGNADNTTLFLRVV